MKRLRVTLPLLPILLLVACSAIEQQARDTAAALGGLLTEAQTQNMAACTATPTLPACTMINRATSAQNALITATEAYCGWNAPANATQPLDITGGNVTQPPANTIQPAADPAGKCVPVASAQAGLKTAIANAGTFITQLKGVIH